MNEKKSGLEAFVERHRADFDLFEPRPDLWDDIERELAAPVASRPEEAPLRVVPLYPAAGPVATGPDAVQRARPYGIAAAVAALLLVGTWFWQHRSEATIWTRTGQAHVTLPAVSAPDPDHSLYAGPDLLATAATNEPGQRLHSAVQRMEAYYAAQITERQQELQHPDQEASSAPQDWQQELTALDSTYQQLKAELYRNPEPDVVLEAMNRNLQIRLDLLNQQLRTQEQIREYHNQPYMVADSRRMP
ncbi:hypothetical protein [Hymenobacter weizhouensis]|uniref:hypothetical protein n=1 Tax=Hymenobacter sp. YIM 151500-1 TaxID=2987689 RepID=UPI0022263BD2|nr:hypothetical protein [Hymenobacter sp. YIM 151500-1]UYZ62948.1 hypothetical protein OIS53_18385 [Hymenobacter sp. YIM 151500-1]